MGSALPTIIPTALKIVSSVSKESNNNKQADIQQQQIAQQQKADEESRQRSLKAAMATRRARNAAYGVDSNDGSAQAVLLGMFDQSEQDIQNRLERDNLRSQAVSQSADSAGSRNLLSLTNDVFDKGFVSTFLS